jgi:hypothetical protein
MYSILLLSLFAALLYVVVILASSIDCYRTECLKISIFLFLLQGYIISTHDQSSIVANEIEGNSIYSYDDSIFRSLYNLLHYRSNFDHVILTETMQLSFE